jgi:hypothetical protein
MLRGMLLIAVILLASSPVRAGEALNEAKARRAQGFNDFYKSYRATKPKKAEDVSKLTQKTVKPASDAVTRALAQEQVDAIRAAGVKVLTPEQADALGKPSKETPVAQTGDKGGASPEENRPADSAAPQRSGVTTAISKGPEPKPETSVDGSKVPSKIDFGKKK